MIVNMKKLMMIIIINCMMINMIYENDYDEHDVAEGLTNLN